ncbi:ubiquitin-like modifier-activating enzyme atg-7 [Aureobasidium melanogenum CBS 110374]|uniref:Ubiquitin-like modifier-activating enzyme ATG7 n=1 Tax=Aureobasidium melanogenum (strain CBS 110374) TaxID=1043003 RepID=A0A074VIG5_AURM1|nr:ubiquitin-like modifier-activating enzyme atg-7 [Aureobasidium melanogenum CBS 110374]KEQ58879.1 ubiquitin-like modifier-activating enzyme atg-7 [Aureobasidium melanogenum CBS 110374]
MEPLKFAPWTSEIDLGFYSALGNLKLNHDRLDSSARRVLGVYQIQTRDPPERSARMQVHNQALTQDHVPAGFYRGEGYIRNFNTMDEYKQVDKAAHIERAGRTIWDAINDGTIFSCPSLLSSFSAICYADLKKFKFTYQFAYPALHSDPTWTCSTAQKLTPQETVELVDKVQTWRYSVDTRQHGFFLAKKIRGADLDDDHESHTPLDEPDDRDFEHDHHDNEPSNTLDYRWKIGALANYETGFFNNVDPDDRYICFADPSTFETNPGWMLRNLLVLVRQRWKLDKLQIMCYRDTHARREQPHSISFKAESIPPSERGPMPKITGWERDTRSRNTSRTIDMGAYMDPTRLADQAVDLNLKLIKWRIAPSIDLDIIKETKCLLLGAGTLGSYVARNLMGWGVRNITIVDNGRVSFSNPVRQPLFDFNDCLKGGSPKAETAVKALKRIYPGVNAASHSLSVPMAGHPIMDDKKVKAEFDQLHKLISDHDAIFILMDTRESRWLPTVMGKAAGKIVLNAALGFDSYMVMRHGVSSQPKEEQLGCYFCNDVVAPANSLKSATLDQQCTVTRPGVAAIASALAVELLVSILQHPDKAAASAPPINNPQAQHPDHPLGSVPHSLRGFLTDWRTLTIRGQAYDCCSACSPTILLLYNDEGWDFVKRAINEKGYVEEVSGLAEVQRRAEELDNEVDWQSEGEEDNDEAEMI